MATIEIVQIEGRPTQPTRAAARCLALMPERFVRATVFRPNRLAPADVAAGVRWMPIQELDLVGYSRFLLQRLPDFITADFVLIVQEDGYILRPDLWREEWLRYDYIGAPWTFPPFVGNGGFSLRSRRLMQATRWMFREDIGEDMCVCDAGRQWLERLGLVFAPVQQAALFAVENAPWPLPTFGFHRALPAWAQGPEYQLPPV